MTNNLNPAGRTLEPCPCCSSNALWNPKETTQQNGPVTYDLDLGYVECVKSCIRTSGLQAQHVAIAAWNTRAEAPAVPVVDKGTRDTLEKIKRTISAAAWDHASDIQKSLIVNEIWWLAENALQPREVDPLAVTASPIQEFTPCKQINREAGITEYVFEDVPTVAKPVLEGVHHFVDWLVSIDDGWLVGMQFWEIHEDPGSPVPEMNGELDILFRGLRANCSPDNDLRIRRIEHLFGRAKSTTTALQEAAAWHERNWAHERNLKVAALIRAEALQAKLDKAADHAERLAVALHRRLHKGMPSGWRPMTGDLIGLIDQIDHMSSQATLTSKGGK